jgi:hypothetical protein
MNYLYLESPFFDTPLISLLVSCPLFLIVSSASKTPYLLLYWRSSLLEPDHSTKSAKTLILLRRREGRVISALSGCGSRHPYV